MKRIKIWLGVAVIAAGFYVAFKVAPPFFNNLQFEDALGEEARLGAYAIAKSDEDVRASVMKKAQEYDIPITADKINIVRGTGALTISTDYTVHVDLPVHPLDLAFHPSSKGKTI